MLTAREKFYLAARRQREYNHANKIIPQAHFVEHAIMYIPADCLTLTEAARKYNRAQSGIYNAISKGQLQSYKIGTNRVVKESDLLEYFASAANRRKDAAYRAMKSRIAKVT